MSSTDLQASAPGSIMFMGEHAVLHGHPSIVCAVDRYIHVTLTPLDSQEIILESEVFPNKTYALTNFPSKLPLEKPYDFILAAISEYYSKLKQGFKLTIQSDFSPNLGLGSSAAVTVAAVALLEKWLHDNENQENIFQVALKCIRRIQGLASGADVAASVYGSVLQYQNEKAKLLTGYLPIVLLYSGSKLATTEVIARVNKQKTDDPEHYENLFNQLDNIVHQTQDAIINHAYESIGRLMDDHYLVQEEMQLVNDAIKTLIEKLTAASSIYGAKISGSGLGDCVVGLGEFPDTEEKVQARITEKGLYYG